MDMTKWLLFGEILSLCIIQLMYAYYHEKNAVMSFRRRLFYWIFRLSSACVILNIICVCTIENYRLFPRWFHICINTLYFVLSIFVCSIIALYVFDLILEQVYDKSCYRKAKVGLSLFFLAFAGVAVTNIWTGKLFYFTADGRYMRGPWNRLGYGIMGAELIMLLLCYYKNRSAVSKKVVQVIRSLPPVALVLTGFQFAYPEMQFNGIIMAAAIYILYTNFQLCQVEKDSLTQLGTRKAMVEDISIKMKNGQPFQLISVSLKHFGVINQKYGHLFGDMLISMIGEWFASYSKDGAAYRFSRVEFVSVFPYKGEETAERNINNICSRFQENWECKKVTCKLENSIFNLIWTGENWTPGRLLEYMDAVKELPEYRNKNFLRFTSSMAERFEDIKGVEHVIQAALKEKQFFIALQPFFCCREHKFCSGEALARVDDFNGRPVPAGKFVPIADRMGVLDDITWIVLERVCKFLSEHRELPLETVSVNLSMEQFLDPVLPEKIIAVLEQFGIPSSKLKIEITEHVIAQDLEYVKKVMCSLCEKGIGFYLDDFGTGYSNFSVVMHLPFEMVKLDRSLLSHIIDSEEDRNVIRQLILLFHSIGVRVVCEGVETKEQLEIVTELGADMMQGYYCARPMAPEAFADFISEAHDPDLPG